MHGSAIGNPTKRANKTCTRSQRHEREHDAMQCNVIKEKDMIGQTFID